MLLCSVYHDLSSMLLCSVYNYDLSSMLLCTSYLRRGIASATLYKGAYVVMPCS
jgi:hypothetical protein